MIAEELDSSVGSVTIISEAVLEIVVVIIVVEELVTVVGLE